MRRSARADAIGLAIAWVRQRTAISGGGTPAATRRSTSDAIAAASLRPSGQRHSSTLSPARWARSCFSRRWGLLAINAAAEDTIRSSRRIVSSAAALIANNPQRLEKQLRAHRAGERVELWRCPDGLSEAAAIACEVERLVAAGVPPPEIAVLCRTHAIARPIASALAERRIPHVVTGGHGFYDRPEVKDVIALLRVLRDPDDVVALARVFTRPPVSLGQDVALPVLSRKDAAALASRLGAGRFDRRARGPGDDDGRPRSFLRAHGEDELPRCAWFADGGQRGGARDVQCQPLRRDHRGVLRNVDGPFARRLHAPSRPCAPVGRGREAG